MSYISYVKLARSEIYYNISRNVETKHKIFISIKSVKTETTETERVL